MNSFIIHDNISSLIHKKCHLKSCHSDIKQHTTTLTIIFSVPSFSYKHVTTECVVSMMSITLNNIYILLPFLDGGKRVKGWCHATIILNYLANYSCLQHAQGWGQSSCNLGRSHNIMATLGGLAGVRAPPSSSCPSRVDGITSQRAPIINQPAKAIGKLSHPPWMGNPNQGGGGAPVGPPVQLGYQPAKP